MSSASNPCGWAVNPSLGLNYSPRISGQFAFFTNHLLQTVIYLINRVI
jgi:hypothetical protein